jgi:hypothetical protein
MTHLHSEALLRHFADLRDRSHGETAVTRAEKEQLFAATVELLDPVAREALGELNADLLLGSGRVTATGLGNTPDGGLAAIWALSWAEQGDAGINPIAIRAHYGRGFHHPHLSGGTVGEWPLNVFTSEQALAELPTLRAIAAADLHNLVFEADYRIVPATLLASPPARRVMGLNSRPSLVPPVASLPPLLSPGQEAP